MKLAGKAVVVLPSINEDDNELRLIAGGGVDRGGGRARSPVRPGRPAPLAPVTIIIIVLLIVHLRRTDAQRRSQRHPSRSFETPDLQLDGRRMVVVLRMMVMMMVQRNRRLALRADPTVLARVAPRRQPQGVGRPRSLPGHRATCGGRGARRVGRS